MWWYLGYQAEKTQESNPMSFIIFKMQCKACKYTFDTAFGVVGTRLIAQPAEKCPKCLSQEVENLAFPQSNTSIKEIK
jgi:predicted Zn-ribbon and HTH transcriptional regulator